MANDLLFPIGIEGLTDLTCDVYPFASDTAVVTNRPLTEADNAKGWYEADTDEEEDTGLHRVVIKDDGDVVATSFVVLTNGGLDVVGLSISLVAFSDVHRYWTVFNYIRDQANEQDVITAVWLRDGTFLSGIDPVTLTLVDALTDETIATDDMDNVGTHHVIVLSGEDRLPLGTPGRITFSATIDGATRTFSHIVSRDTNGG